LFIFKNFPCLLKKKIKFFYAKMVIYIKKLKIIINGTMKERKKISFQERYKTGETPWEIDRVDTNLVNIISEVGIEPCNVLDIGCGTGNNSIWLAEQKYQVSGCDTITQAIETAKQKSELAGVKCSFFQADFLGEKSKTSLYSLLFDRGCFHCFDEPDQRLQFVYNCYSLLDKNGLWISLIGNCDEERQEKGPPQMSGSEIAKVVEPYFEILMLKSGLFDSNLDNPPRAWLCLFKKRTIDNKR